MKEKTGIIDVGGGFRGVYAAGVLDYCMDHGISFDYGAGVSAGSANLVTYAAGQVRRNLKFYTEYGLRPAYAGLRNFLRKRSFLDLDYVYSTLSNSDGESPLDYPALAASPMELQIVTTRADTGDAVYFTKADLRQDRYDVVKASCALPYFCRPYPLAGRLYYDGALSDPVPVEKALEAGCGKIVLLLTLPADTVRDPARDARVARRIERQFPRAASKLRGRAERYNRGVARAKELASQGRLLIVAPDDTCGVDTLCRDPEAMGRLYAKGYEDGKRMETFL